MLSLQPEVHVHEVAPRDGLQNESISLSVDDKLELISRLNSGGVNSVEVGSFVRADVIPQLANTGEVVDGLNVSDNYYYALILNQRGFEKMVATTLTGATIVVSATDEHSRANAGVGLENAQRLAGDLIRSTIAAGKQVRAYVAMAFVCPFAGQVTPENALKVVDGLVAAGARLVVLADTLGVAQPGQVAEIINLVKKKYPSLELGLHMHDTEGRAIENCRKGYQLGVRHFDAAIGGCGGCPFAPGAAGNLDTLELLAMLDEVGAAHSLQLAELSSAADFLAERLAGRI